MKKLLLIIPILLLSGCGVTTTSTTEKHAPAFIDGRFDVYGAFEDKERGVTCWVFYNKGGYDGGGGLSCIPNSQLTNNQ